ncbi:MAG: hypothetical protein DMF63_10385 [Acidobacteria bacterium]|nr:MAG: hypothetical protein DMF63_10385 [Acidobacteriota bacterium]
MAVFDPDELSFELGIWLAGLDSFLKQGDQTFSDKNRPTEATGDWSRECRLTRAALLNASKLTFRLRKAVAGPIPTEGDIAVNGYSTSELDDFALVLRDTIVLNESVIGAAKSLNFADWRAWSSILSEKLDASPVYHKLIRGTRHGGANFLPTKLKELMTQGSIPFADEVDLQMILPQFGTILGTLGIVGKMLRNDEPLKPSLIIFARVYELTNDLITHMNNRLSRYPNEEAAMFDSLDGASYTASLELRKVFSQELTGLVGIRPVPSVFARVETAYELLSDSFRQILAGFARVVDSDILPAEVFPNFQTKLEQSLLLRQNLWKSLKAVQAAEQEPDKTHLEAVGVELREFLERTISFIFHKDRETFERFSEEIFATGEKKDIVPILHRFGAYIETLLAQVNMRTVLAEYPFDPSAK